MVHGGMKRKIIRESNSMRGVIMSVLFMRSPSSAFLLVSPSDVRKRGEEFRGKEKSEVKRTKTYNSRY